MNAQLDKDGGPPNDGNTGARILRVEEKLTAVEGRLAAVEGRLTSVEGSLASIRTDLAVIQSNYATKDYIHREISAQTWRLVTFVCAFNAMLVGATFFIATSLA